MASIVLAIHLLWILWVISGALWTRGRPFLAAFHLLSLLWGIVVEVSPLPCPLTITEQFFEVKAGAHTYSGGFVEHLLDRIVYPDVPASFLIRAGVAICAVNLALYVCRYLNRALD